jgi:hypothetical protein
VTIKSSICEVFRVLRLETEEVSSITGSERLISPRWSPDETQILALKIGKLKPRIFDAARGEWRLLSERRIVCPNWGSLLTLKVRERCGFQAMFCQIRAFLVGFYELPLSPWPG